MHKIAHLHFPFSLGYEIADLSPRKSGTPRIWRRFGVFRKEGGGKEEVKNQVLYNRAIGNLFISYQPCEVLLFDLIISDKPRFWNEENDSNHAQNCFV